MERLRVSASHFVRNDIGLITHLPEVHEVPPFEGDMRSTSVITPDDFLDRFASRDYRLCIDCPSQLRAAMVVRTVGRFHIAFRDLRT